MYEATFEIPVTFNCCGSNSVHVCMLVLAIMFSVTSVM